MAPDGRPALALVQCALHFGDRPCARRDEGRARNQEPSTALLEHQAALAGPRAPVGCRRRCRQPARGLGRDVQRRRRRWTGAHRRGDGHEESDRCNCRCNYRSEPCHVLTPRYAARSCQSTAPAPTHSGRDPAEELIASAALSAALAGASSRTLRYGPLLTALSEMLTSRIVRSFEDGFCQLAAASTSVISTRPRRHSANTRTAPGIGPGKGSSPLVQGITLARTGHDYRGRVDMVPSLWSCDRRGAVTSFLTGKDALCGQHR